MSKIKDLLATVEGIDDLEPAKPSVETIAKMAVEKCEKPDVEKTIENEAQFGYGTDDDGHVEVYLENFCDICQSIARDSLDEMIEECCLDLSDTEYFKALDIARDVLADAYADFESELCDNELNDYNVDKKFLN